MMLRSAARPAVADDLFAAAANAAKKGQAQYLTPAHFGRRVTALLPEHRPTLCDLTCGQGDLLAAAANHSTRAVLGLDLDAEALAVAAQLPRTAAGGVIHGELTAALAPLVKVGWQADLFVLNPPWDHHWFRAPLAPLLDSDLPAVAQAIAAHDGRTPRECVDSTIATLALALDRSSRRGEGVLLANEATLQRLLLRPGAPHAPLLEHCWGHAVFHDFLPSGLGVGVLWFARSHRSGPAELPAELFTRVDAARTRADLAPLRAEARRHHRGLTLPTHDETWRDHLGLWQAVGEELAARRAEAAGQARGWHLYLEPGGVIGTRLSRYEQHGGVADLARLKRLRSLQGRTPLQLVIQKAERDLLLGVVEQDGWRVEPALAEAVRQAVAGYHRQRAPLAPLNDIQRLGYLDEESHLHCRRDLALPGRGAAFAAGQRYPLASRTVEVRRRVTRFNGLTGEDEELELTGQQLALTVTGPGGPVCFMDATLREPGHTLPDGVTVDATLHELVRHFTIPEVPDIATLQPAAYERHRATLRQLETLLTA